MITKRNADLTIDVLNGETLKNTGLKYEICLERVRQIVAKTCRKANKDKYSNMPRRATTDVRWLRERKAIFINSILNT